MQAIFCPPLSGPLMPLPINWRSPITSGLRFSTYNSAQDYALGPRNYVTQVSPRTNTKVGRVNTSLGVVPSFDGVASVASVIPTLGGVVQFTVSFWLWWNSYANDDRRAMQFATDPSVDVGSFFVNPNSSSSGGGNFGISIYSGVSNVDGPLFARPSAAAWHFYCFTADLSTTAAPPLLVFEVDGKAQSVTGGGNTFIGPVALGNYTLSIMGTPVGTPTLFGAGRIANINIWDRLLQAGERQSMYYNSLQVLDPGFYHVGMPPAAPTANTSRWFLGA